MTVKIGVAGIPYCCEGFEDGLRWLAENGLHEEIQFVRQVWMTRERAEKTRELAEGLGVELSAHAPYYVNLANPEKVEASKKRILDSCDRAELCGAKIVVFHPGFYGTDKEKAFSRIKKACAEMAKETSVLLGLETMGRQKQFGTIEEIMRIHEELPGCVPVLDFSHLFARNNGKIEFGAVLDSVSELKHIHSHFTGVKYSNGNEVHHLPISSKSPDFGALAKEIKKRGTDITIICEAPVPAEDALRMKEYF